MRFRARLSLVLCAGGIFAGHAQTSDSTPALSPSPSVRPVTTSLISQLQGKQWIAFDTPMLVDRVRVEGRRDAQGFSNVALHAFKFRNDLYDARMVSQLAPTGSNATEIAEQKGAVLAINAGTFTYGADNSLSPVGVLRIAGTDLYSAEQCSMCSGLLSIKDGRVRIGWSRDAATAEPFDHAVQIGPIVVEPGGKPGIKSDGPRADRAGICLRGKDHYEIVIVLAAGSGGLSLLEFAEILRAPQKDGGFGCERAINLDGGPSAQFAYKSSSGEIRSLPDQVPGAGPRAKVQNFLVFFDRKQRSSALTPG